MLHSYHLCIVLLLVVQFKFEFVEFEFGLKCLNQIQKNAKPSSIFFPGPSLFFHPSGPENFSRGPFSLRRPIFLSRPNPSPFPSILLSPTRGAHPSDPSPTPCASRTLESERPVPPRPRRGPHAKAQPRPIKAAPRAPLETLNRSRRFALAKP